MQTVRTVSVVAFKLISFASEGEGSMTDAVGKSSDKSAEETGVLLIGLRSLISEVDIDQFSVAVRSKYRDDSSAHIGYGDGEAVCVSDSVEFSLLPV